MRRRSPQKKRTRMTRWALECGTHDSAAEASPSRGPLECRTLEFAAEASPSGVNDRPTSASSWFLLLSVLPAVAAAHQPAVLGGKDLHLDSTCTF